MRDLLNENEAQYGRDVFESEVQLYGCMHGAVPVVVGGLERYFGENAMLAFRCIPNHM